MIGVVDDLARRDIFQAWPRPPVPGMADLIDIAGHEIFEVLVGRSSIEKALSVAQDRADRLMRDKGCY